MAIINYKYGYLFLAEGYCGSRATKDALLNTHPGSKELASHHHSLPQLLSGNFITKEQLKKYLTFSVIRHPLDILATQVAKSNRSVPWWLIHRYITRQQDNTLFYFHYGSDLTLRYERGLNLEINKALDLVNAPRVYIPWKYQTINKKDWRDIFSKDDLEFAYATIPELFAFGYVDSNIRNGLRSDWIKEYLKKYG